MFKYESSLNRVLVGEKILIYKNEKGDIAFSSGLNINPLVGAILQVYTDIYPTSQLLNFDLNSLTTRLNRLSYLLIGIHKEYGDFPKGRPEPYFQTSFDKDRHSFTVYYEGVEVLFFNPKEKEASLSVRMHSHYELSDFVLGLLQYKVREIVTMEDFLVAFKSLNEALKATDYKYLLSDTEILKREEVLKYIVSYAEHGIKFFETSVGYGVNLHNGAVLHLMIQGDTVVLGDLVIPLPKGIIYKDRIHIIAKVLIKRVEDLIKEASDDGVTKTIHESN